MGKPHRPDSAPAVEKNSGKRAGFKKGQSGNPSGRPKGVKNKATLEIKAFCQGLFKRPAFQKNLKKQWDDLTLDPAYRALLTHYAFGKPPTAVEIDVTGFDPLKYLARDDRD